MDGIKPHKHMAGMPGSSEGTMGDFGVDKFHSARVNGSGGSMNDDPKEKMPHGMNSKMLGDGERANPPPIGRGSSKMPATAHSDHGPHNFGVASMKAMNG
jgi:hypothetical protein